MHIRIIMYLCWFTPNDDYDGQSTTTTNTIQQHSGIKVNGKLIEANDQYYVIMPHLDRTTKGALALTDWLAHSTSNRR